MRISDWSSDVCSSDLPEAEAQLVLAEATLNYNERMLANLRASLANGGSATILTGGGADGAPVLSKLSPPELGARITELESTYGLAKATRTTTGARPDAGPRCGQGTAGKEGVRRAE